MLQRNTYVPVCKKLCIKLRFRQLTAAVWLSHNASILVLQARTLSRKARITLLNCSGLCSGAKWLTPGKRNNSAPGILPARYLACSSLINSSCSLCTIATGVWMPAKSIAVIVGLGFHHQANRIDKRHELIRRGRQLGVVLGVTAETSVDGRAGHDFLCAAGIHVATKEEYTSNTRGGLHGKDQSYARAVAPADDGCLFEMQCIHHGENIGRHQLIGKRPQIARAATMTPAINNNDATARADHHWNLITPITAMAEATMQQDYGRAGAVCGEPDPRAIVIHVTLIACDRQGRSTMDAKFSGRRRSAAFRQNPI